VRREVPRDALCARAVTFKKREKDSRDKIPVTSRKYSPPFLEFFLRHTNKKNVARFPPVPRADDARAFLLQRDGAALPPSFTFVNRFCSRPALPFDIFLHLGISSEPAFYSGYLGFSLRMCHRSRSSSSSSGAFCASARRIIAAGS